MRPVSLKRQQLNRQVNPIRDDYRRTYTQCQWCGDTATELHEIARGPNRKDAIADRNAWLHLCSDCHRAMSMVPLALQYAIKALTDPFHFDREQLNLLRGRAKNAVSEIELQRWMRRLTLEA